MDVENGKKAQQHLLIVDDDPKSLYSLEALLQPLGALIHTAASGEEALRTVFWQPFDLILLDVRLPGIDGFVTADMVRACPGCENLPILFMSGGEDPREQAIAGDYMRKPLDPDLLRAKVTDLLRSPVQR